MTFRLTIEPLDQQIELKEDQTILDACLRAGIYLPHACCHGLCATCKVEVIDGDIEHGDASSFALMDYEREEGKCLACCATLQSDVTIEVDVEVEPDARNIPVRDFIGHVTRIEQLTPTIKGVFIRLDGSSSLQFQAGQYINLNIPGEPTGRAFSLANRPGTDELELNIKLVPGGRATSWIHEKLAVGDPLSLSGPYGRFFVRKSANVPLILFAGGSGLSSPRSMILDLVEEKSAVPITLFYGARNIDELYYHQQFAELSGRIADFAYVPVLSSEPQDSRWAGTRGLLHDAAREYFKSDFRDHKAYLCGPPAMIDSCITTLIQGRLFERDIYIERFFSAADTQQLRSPLFRKL